MVWRFVRTIIGQFDRGWFGIGDDFRIVVPEGRVYEEVEGMRAMSDYDGREIFLPGVAGVWPRREALAWYWGESLALMQGKVFFFCGVGVMLFGRFCRRSPKYIARMLL